MLVDIINPLSLPFFDGLDEEIKKKVNILRKVNVDCISKKCSFRNCLCFYISLLNFLRAILEQYNGGVNKEFHDIIYQVSIPLRGRIDSGFIFPSENIRRKDLRKTKSKRQK